MLAQQPRVLDVVDYHENETCAKAGLTCSATLADQEKEQLQKLQSESQQILAETENMVLELLEKARQDAQTIIQDAQEEAGLVRVQVYEEAGTIREQAREEGYREGLKQAQDEIEADRQAALEQSQAILEEARQTKIKAINSMERDISRLVMAVSKKIIAGELTTNPQIILHVVREAISFLDKPENITVYVNPHDLEKVLTGIETHELEEGNHITPMEARATDRIAAGGCIIESDIGQVDARLQTREANVERALLEVADDE